MGGTEYGAHVDASNHQARVCVHTGFVDERESASSLHCSSVFRFDAHDLTCRLLIQPVVACIALGSEDAVRTHRREVKKALVDSIEEAGPAANTGAETVRTPDMAVLR